MINIELFFSKNKAFHPHFLQLITGFSILQQHNILRLHKRCDNSITFPFSSIFAARINKKINVLFDICDGTDNFVLSEQLNYFKNKNYILFKRAYDKSLYRNYSFIMPLGLNYYGLFGPVQHFYLHLLYTQPLFRNYLLDHLSYSFFPDMEKYWTMKYKSSSQESNSVLFCTRLHDFKKTKDETIPALNDRRISITRQIRKYFNKRAIAGIIDSPIARRLCPDLILHNATTDRKNYIRLMNRSTICIATTGLYHSTGWRFAEYIAAGKAIITEPLNYIVPGDFRENKNYLSFKSMEQLISSIDYLLLHPQIVQNMQINNLLYFHHYLRPDSLIFNVLKTTLSS